ncbi:hypothetical protein BDW74DRAFT_176104 [Aspergillus multicolor]|uniref:uncharacterized protein n=1 Tax=Aspergillus multicolor TaxID=41759 RepID=UPI003CCE22F5
MSFVKNTQLLGERTIKVVTSRPVRNIAESRLILAALQKFGEVVHFRNAPLLRINNRHVQALLKETGTPQPTTDWTQFKKISQGDGPGRYINAVFDSPTAAQNAMDASPLTVDTSPQSPSSPDDAQSDQIIQCDVTHAPSINEQVMSRNPWYGPFKQETESPVYEDLAKQLKGETAGLQYLADAPRASKKDGPAKPVARKFKKAIVSQIRADSLMNLWQEGIARRKRAAKRAAKKARAERKAEVERQAEAEKKAEKQTEKRAEKQAENKAELAGEESADGESGESEARADLKAEKQIDG